MAEEAGASLLSDGHQPLAGGAEVVPRLLSASIAALACIEGGAPR
jgi:hypothetical protein